LDETAESNEPPETLPPTKKRKSRGGSENLDDVREYVKKAKGMKRLEFIVSLHRRFSEPTKLSESARNLINTAGLPMVRCLESIMEITRKILAEMAFDKRPAASQRFARANIIARAPCVASVN
jgi:hypothetical protein